MTDWRDLGGLTGAQATVARLLGPLDGKRIPGGCDQCNAFQTVDPVEAGVWVTTVHHDEDCPVLAAHEGRNP